MSFNKQGTSELTVQFSNHFVLKTKESVGLHCKERATKGKSMTTFSIKIHRRKTSDQGKWTNKKWEGDLENKHDRIS